MDSTRHGLLLSPLLCSLGASACSGNPGGEATDTANTDTAASESASADDLTAPGFVIDGAEVGDAIVAIPIEDVDGDGLGELLINANRPLHPVAFLVFGKTDSEPVDLADVEAGISDAGILLDVWDGETEFNHEHPAPKAVAVGDVNGDGLNDLGVALYSDTVARAHVVFGAADLPDPLDLPATAAGASGFTIDTSTDAVIEPSRELYGVGDVNGDGFDDLLLAQIGSFGDHYALLYGDPQPIASDLADLEAGVGGVLLGTPYSARVLDPADVNGDGYADVVYAEYGGPFEPEAYVLIRAGAQDFALDPATTFVAVSSDLSDPIDFDSAAVGDLDGDGRADVVIAASYYSDFPLTVFVVFGATLSDSFYILEAFPGHGYTVDLEGLDLEFSAYGRLPPIEGVRDIDGDGNDELLFRTTSGTYLLYGKADVSAQVLVDDGVHLDDLALGEYIGVVTGWGSVRGGAPTDLVIAAPEASPAGRSGAGRAYVLFDALAEDAG
ncbi:MAG: VCBS repeat-containing protein [Myxococcales bacterium]|nr:VCBS repeat-containing protein [Myxococcales bacterium]